VGTEHADVTAYERFFRANAVRTVRLAALLGAPDPEDVAQEAFCRVFAARSRLRSIDDSAVPYLNRTVVNLVRSGARRSALAAHRVHVPMDVVASAEHEATDREDVRRVAAAVGGLPARQREAVVLRYWLDLPYADVAAAMGVRPGTAKSMVSRALAALGGQLEEE
jgi:RNA polymerase sigma factor (sigma-70 family)